VRLSLAPAFDIKIEETEMNDLKEIKKRLDDNKAELLRKIPKAQRSLSQTPQTNPFKRHHLKILKILKELETVLLRK
jgi:hypothetical protein